MKTVNERLYHFEATPPPELWPRIAGELPGGKVLKISSRKKTKRIAFITAAAAIAVLALINFLFLDKTNVQSGTQIAEKVDSNYREKNNELLETIIKAPGNKKLAESSTIASDGFMRYFTVRGPQGEPVKISPKVATLILSADDEYPPKPVWDKKIGEWQKIMLTNNITPTSANLIEIIQQASNTMR